MWVLTKHDVAEVRLRIVVLLSKAAQYFVSYCLLPRLLATIFNLDFFSFLVVVDFRLESATIEQTIFFEQKGFL